MVRLVLTVALCFTAGCTEQVPACEVPGEVFDGERCGPRLGMDGSVDAATDGGPPDGGPDAGPCVPACSGGQVCRADDGMCVDCTESAPCMDPRVPTCEAGTCVAGCDETTCGRFASEPHCEAASGRCVECLATPESEATDCDGRSCDPTTFECTATLVGTVGRCERCAASSECDRFDAGGATTYAMACAQTSWAGGDAGFYCVVDHAAAGSPPITCPNGTPRFQSGLVTREGTTSDFCVPVAETTCPAINDDEACTEDAQCGLPDENDGICFMTRCESFCSMTSGDAGCPGMQTCEMFAGRYVCSG